MSIGVRFLQIYDSCKQSQTPEQCRDMVMAAAPALIRSYLGGYDLCLRGFSQETCRRVFLPAKTPRTRAALWFGAGVAVGFIIRKVL